MKARWIVASLAVSLVALVVAVGQADDKADKLKGAKCPVSGKDINPDCSSDFGGGKVYFCCGNCPKAFAKDTKKYTAKANLQLAKTGQVTQAKCPISKQPCKAEQAVEVEGTKVYFCCGNCKGKFEKMSADEKLACAFGDITKTFTPAEKK